MLWRALKNIKNGFYVDIGAQDPIVDSVSYAFYERGWRGLNIEPVPIYAEKLRKNRPDEVVMQIAISDHEGTLELFELEGTGLSSAIEDHALRHAENRGLKSNKIVVPTLTLDKALESFIDCEIHWMKVDVEGYEEFVFRGWTQLGLDLGY